VTRDSPTPRRTRLAAYAVALNNESILLARIAAGYPGEGKWTLPGGGVEWGEHPEEALVREVHEETGFFVTQFSLLGINSRVFHASRLHSDLHAVRLLYDVPLDGDPAVTEIDGSVDHASWVPLDNIGSMRIVELVRVGLEMKLH
jgi:8-oxo-dGTP diphosphatase